MSFTFDGDNLLIILDAGTTSVDTKDLYSRWKDWFKTGDNAKYPVAFRTIGGDPITVNLSASPYFFLQNDLGWRIRPAEEDATIGWTGNLVPEDVTLPIVVPTLGDYTVLINGLQPVTQNVDGAIAVQMDEMHKIWGLDANNPMVSVKTPGQIAQTAGDVTRTHVEAPTDTVTTTRS